MTNQEEYNAQWRASAHEAVPYTEDLAECFLVLPELIDGSIAQGNASKVTIDIQIKDNKGTLKVTDNGIGIKSNIRWIHFSPIIV